MVFTSAAPPWQRGQEPSGRCASARARVAAATSSDFRRSCQATNRRNSTTAAGSSGRWPRKEPSASCHRVSCSRASAMARRRGERNTCSDRHRSLPLASCAIPVSVPAGTSRKVTGSRSLSDSVKIRNREALLMAVVPDMAGSIRGDRLNAPHHLAGQRIAGHSLWHRFAAKQYQRGSAAVDECWLVRRAKFMKRS